MTRKLAIIHTSAVTIAPLKELVQDTIEDVELVNFLDDSILPQLLRNGGDIREVEARWYQYVVIAEQLGADCILSACSSVGDLVPGARKRVSVPVFRIDEPMAERAIEMGSRVGVAATLETTLRPTERLLRRKATGSDRSITIQSWLASEAYRKLLQGDAAGHDDELTQGLAAMAQEVDVVVLAQASMARVLPRLPVDLQAKVLSSPLLGIAQVGRLLNQDRQV